MFLLAYQSAIIWVFPRGLTWGYLVNNNNNGLLTQDQWNLDLDTWEPGPDSSHMGKHALYLPVLFLSLSDKKKALLII